MTNSITAVADQALPKGWSVATAFRYATGKPFTPVTGATYDALHEAWTPIYGAPYSDRLPAAIKWDVAFSRVMRISSRSTLVCFFSVDNVLDRTNLYQYAYNPDYSERIPVRSLFNRSLYFGGSLTYLGRS